MNDEASARKEAAAIVSEMLGSETGQLFSLSIKKKKLEEILGSLADLLVEFMGEIKAKEITEHIYNKYHKTYTAS